MLDPAHPQAWLAVQVLGFIRVEGLGSRVYKGLGLRPAFRV